MNRAELDTLIAELMVEHFVRLKAELLSSIVDLVADGIEHKALPPFVPPPAWVEGKRWSAGISVRHRGGIFYAQRDTSGEPALDEAWVPLIVGLAGIDLRWLDDGHTFTAHAALSDGRVVEHQCEIAVPIVRGYWTPEETYMPGDRVFRYGEHHCLKMSLGIDPTSAEAAGHWEKVGGKHARDLSFALDETTGELTENGRVVGNVRRVFVAAVAEALAKRAA
jgi:hypothetical protein